MAQHPKAVNSRAILLSYAVFARAYLFFAVSLSIISDLARVIAGLPRRSIR